MRKPIGVPHGALDRPGPSTSTLPTQQTPERNFFIKLLQLIRTNAKKGPSLKAQKTQLQNSTEELLENSLAAASAHPLPQYLRRMLSEQNKGTQIRPPTHRYPSTAFLQAICRQHSTIFPSVPPSSVTSEAAYAVEPAAAPITLARNSLPASFKISSTQNTDNDSVISLADLPNVPQSPAASEASLQGWGAEQFGGLPATSDTEEVHSPIFITPAVPDVPPNLARESAPARLENTRGQQLAALRSTAISGSSSAADVEPQNRKNLREQYFPRAQQPAEASSAETTPAVSPRAESAASLNAHQQVTLKININNEGDLSVELAPRIASTSGGSLLSEIQPASPSSAGNTPAGSARAHSTGSKQTLEPQSDAPVVSPTIPSEVPSVALLGQEQEKQLRILALINKLSPAQRRILPVRAENLLRQKKCIDIADIIRDAIEKGNTSQSHKNDKTSLMGIFKARFFKKDLANFMKVVEGIINSVPPAPAAHSDS